MSRDFTDYIAGILITHSAETKTGDLIIDQDADNQILYVDVEGQSLYLITVHEAVAEIKYTQEEAVA